MKNSRQATAPAPRSTEDGGPGSGDQPAVAPLAPAYYQERLWRRLAPLYDVFFRLTFLPLGGQERVRQGLVDFADPQPGERVLDVGCGTGALTVLLAERVGPQGQAAGVDLSSEMIAQARRKRKLRWLTFHRANTEALPFPSGSFDKSFLSLFIHEMPEPARRATLSEVVRTLRPQGGVYILDFNMPPRLLPRLVLKGLLRLAEEEPARRMVSMRTLVAEVEAAGLVVLRRKLLLAETMVMLHAARR